MNIQKRLGVIIALFVLISAVHAQGYDLFSGKFHELGESQQKMDFEFYNGTYDICENEKKTIPILVVNRGGTGNSYKLSASGAGWARLNVQEFSLPKSQSGVVFLELSPDSSTNGRHVIGITSLAAGIGKNLNIDANVEKCRSARLDILEEDRVCGGVKKQYDGEIINDGMRKSDIELNVSGPNWINADKNTFSIGAGEREGFKLNAEIPSNANGIFSVFLSAAVKSFPSIKSGRKLSIDVVPKHDCYRADIIADAEIENEFSNEYFPVRIRNSGVKQAIYEINLEAPDWVSVEPKKLAVNPGQIGNVNLNINPGDEADGGNYPIKINANFEGAAYSKAINVKLSKNRLLKNLKQFLVFYQHYIYIILLFLIILLIFRKQIKDKIRILYKNYRTKQARLKSLEAARKARGLKKQLNNLEKSEAGIKEVKKHGYKKLFLYFIGFAVIASVLTFSAYNFNFPVSKEFIKGYYPYFIAGFLISVFIIFLIEFYRPLFGLLRKLK